VLVGLGFLETIALPITSPALNYDAFRREPNDTESIRIQNPIHDESGTALSMLRADLLPGLLACLARYRGGELPQRLFEVGDVTHHDPDTETGAREIRRAAAVSIGARAGFAEARSLAGAVLREMGWELEAVAEERPWYLAGRAARLDARLGERRVTIGHFGEIHPEVLERFGLGYPVAAMELDVTPLIPAD
jgi:phenylalanyl-tRNA synthetase beta chain